MTTDKPTWLESVARTMNSTAILYETNGTPSGAAGLGDVGIAAYALSAELASKSDDLDAAMDSIARHKLHAPETFETVLYGAILNLLSLELEPAFKLLDKTSTDRRKRAERDWEAIRAQAKTTGESA